MSNNPSVSPNPEPTDKPARVLREEATLKKWQEQDIFGQTLNKASPRGEFTFYEGPPTANGHPGIHHLEARAFKDAIPRYRTMRGYHVRRKGGWDTHGLPVELQVEKQLGLKSKKEIESYGVEAFNEKCKESVWTYVHEWEDFTRRMGYWVDLNDPYVTYKPQYIESVWNVIKTADDKGLVYKDYKVVPWCPRCGTALSSHELAQGYADVKDMSVTVKFKAKPNQKIGNLVTDDKTFILAWTTTPWTLPGNVGLAVNPNIQYVQIDMDKQSVDDKGKYILASDRMIVLEEKAKKKDTTKPFYIDNLIYGKELVGLEYEPLYPFLRDNISHHEKDKLVNAFKVYAADFVTTTDGTGIVHTAVMYGQDDFELGTKVGLPKHHLVHEDGTFKKECGFLAGAFVKDEGTEVAIIKDLAGRGLLFAKEKYQHSYPFCWRCKTPLIYFARDSWYIRMSELREKMMAENEKIHWEPGYIKEGRFGEWLREVKDWAISRERYWGTPLPIWTCHQCHARKVVGSIADVTQTPKNHYFVMRHGEAEDNVKNILNSDEKVANHLTAHGRAKATATAETLKAQKIDLIIASPLPRTQETAKIVQQTVGLPADKLITDKRIREMGLGELDGHSLDEFMKVFPMSVGRFDPAPRGIESYAALKKRMGDFLYDIESKYAGKNILIVTHGSPAMMLMAAAAGWDRSETIAYEKDHYIHKAEARPLDFRIVPHNTEYELDLHKPFIDEVKLTCACGGEMHRAKEVLDVWFDSGSMPFAQDHYPFGGSKARGWRAWFGGAKEQKIAYPADFISEAIDQTRGWFYTLHAVGAILGKGRAYNNVICLGHILDAEGKKMSKSLGNIVDPMMLMDRYGADALRFWMYSINQPGESKNFDEKTVDEVVKKVFNLAANVASFYEMYAKPEVIVSRDSKNVLDRWIIAKLDELTVTVTKHLESYVFFEPTRAIRDFIADLSQWYLRRSRDRFKEEGSGRVEALQTTRYVLLTLTKIMAPFTPFFAEELYQNAGGTKDSVHLEDWPEAGKIDQTLINDMELVRKASSLGLEARMKAKLNVRQPLATLFVKDQKYQKLEPALVELIQAEVNVKRVVFDLTHAEEVVLDLEITPALKEEGELRELLRKIQDLRKEKGLTVNDMAILSVPEEFKALISKNETEIKRLTKLVKLEPGATLDLRRSE